LPVDLLQETFLIGLQPTHHLADATGLVSLAAFADDDSIVPSTEGFLIQGCRDAGFEPRVVSTTSDRLTARGLIARGLGVGWVASLLVDDYNGIVVRPLKDPMRRRDIYLLLPPDDRHPLAEQLTDALTATAQAIDPRVRGASRPSLANFSEPS
jgi:DNA-binding transcriptional LysR family regulator